MRYKKHCVRRLVLDLDLDLGSCCSDGIRWHIDIDKILNHHI
jgi:hypothetical protein